MKDCNENNVLGACVCAMVRRGAGGDWAVGGGKYLSVILVTVLGFVVSLFWFFIFNNSVCILLIIGFRGLQCTVNL